MATGENVFDDDDVLLTSRGKLVKASELAVAGHGRVITFVETGGSCGPGDLLIADSAL